MSENDPLRQLKLYVQNRVEEFAESVVTQNELTREQLFQRFRQRGQTTIDDDCGYISTSEITIESLYHLYKRDPLARRICSVWPGESWRKFPTISDDEDPTKDTPFKKAFIEFCRRMNQYSWSNNKTATSVFWSELKKADELAQVGGYACLVIGYEGEGDLSTPLEGLEDDYGDRYTGVSEDADLTNNIPDGEKDDESKPKPNRKNRFRDVRAKPAPVDGDAKLRPVSKKKRKVAYITAYSEYHCRVVKWDTNRSSRRYGMPVEYALHQYTDDRPVDHVTEPRDGQTVHWSRVVHICPNAMESRYVADSRLLVTFNRLYDSLKVYGGAGEGFFQGALPAISYEPISGEKVELDAEAIEEARTSIEEYLQRMKRYLLSDTLSAKPIAPSVVSPKDHLDVIIESICIVLPMPSRVFRGSERGELASSQDQSAHDDRCELRQHDVITPRVIAPLVDHLINTGALPEPDSGGWEVHWPSLKEKKPLDRADLVSKIVEFLSKAAQGGVLEYISAEDLLSSELFMDMPKDVVEGMLSKAIELADEKADADADKMIEMQKKMGATEQPAEDAPKPGQPKLPAPSDGKLPADKKQPTDKTAEPGKPNKPAQPPRGNKPTGNSDVVVLDENDEPLTNEELDFLDNVLDDFAPITFKTYLGGTRLGESLTGNANCGIGPGGFQPGNKCARGGAGRVSGPGDASIPKGQKIPPSLGLSHMHSSGKKGYIKTGSNEWTGVKKDKNGDWVSTGSTRNKPPKEVKGYSKHIGDATEGKGTINPKPKPAPKADEKNPKVFTGEPEGMFKPLMDTKATASKRWKAADDAIDVLKETDTYDESKRATQLAMEDAVRRRYNSYSIESHVYYRDKTRDYSKLQERVSEDSRNLDRTGKTATEFKEQRMQRSLNMLRASNRKPGQIDVQLVKGSNTDAVDMMNSRTKLEHVKNSMNGLLDRDISVRCEVHGKNNRAYADPNKAKYVVSPHSRQAVHAHEMGHVLEHASPGLKKAANGYLMEHFNGELDHMNAYAKGGYRADEVVFAPTGSSRHVSTRGAYQARTYAGHHTEVVSMIMEDMYENGYHSLTINEKRFVSNLMQGNYDE